MFKRSFHLLINALIALFATQTLAMDSGSGTLFPLEDNGVWYYTGTYEKGESDGEDTEIIEFNLKSEVVRFVTGGGYVGAHMMGHPFDALSILDGAVCRSSYVYYLLGNDVYLIENQQDMNTAMGGRYDPSAEEKFISFPLISGLYQGTIVGESGWVVKTTRISVPALRGPVDGYAFIMKKPDEGKMMTFAPGVGITAYYYIDYTTGEKIKLKLTEYILTE
ncbi:MAG: hypothetical protein JW885_14580 [Deltaproteobacteria bacterium]|nr:hypothetical protein [Candidatus Zymogenaceae bacterium]